jgi:drug/metabolite transporter (DMT)-like permease
MLCAFTNGVQCQMARLSDQTLGVMQVSTATVLLGTLGVCVRESGQGPWVTVWWRCLIGAVTIALLSGDFRNTLALPRNMQIRLATLACGLLMTLTWVLFFASLSHLPIAVATVVFQVQPLMLMLWGVLVLRERVFPREWTAAVTVLAGIALVAAPPLRGSVAGGASALAGVVLCIGAAGCFTGVTVIARKTTVSPQGLACWQCVIGAVCLSWVPAVEGFPSTLSGWAWLSDLGAIHTGLAYVLLYAGVRRTTTVQIALLQFISPLAAVLLDWCVYKQTLGPLQLDGLVLAAVGLTIATRRRDVRSKSELLSPDLTSEGAKS